jgi:ubiquinone/menaquinone biosynthesis C-methylase UbiE
MSLVEQWKYEKCYELESYRMGVQRYKYTLEDIGEIQAGQTYLDVGCGRGEMLDAVESNGGIVTGIETVPALCDGKRVIHGDGCALPFEDNAFDYVSCYDVLEHIPRTEDDLILNELARVCRGIVFISTNDRPSFLSDPVTQEKIDLHINKRPQSDWHRKVTAVWNNTKFRERGHWKDWHWRCSQ